MEIRFRPKITGRLIDPRIFCATGSKVQSIIAETREALSKREVEVLDALMYLGEKSRSYSSRGQRSEALELFDEGKKIFDAANDPALFQWGLRIAAQGFELGRPADARALFDHVMGWIPSRESEQERDEIRMAAALTYNDLGMADAALEVTSQMEKSSYKFSMLLDIADSLIKSGDNGKAKEVLLNLCAVAAREPDQQQYSPRNTKISSLLEIARRLIGLNQIDDGEKLLAEAANNIPHIYNREKYDFEQLEDIAILLLVIGKKQKAIDLLVSSWLNEDVLTQMSPEERAATKLGFVKEHHTCERFAKALEAEEKQQSA